MILAAGGACTAQLPLGLTRELRELLVPLASGSPTTPAGVDGLREAADAQNVNHGLKHEEVIVGRPSPFVSTTTDRDDSSAVKLILLVLPCARPHVKSVITFRTPHKSKPSCFLNSSVFAV